MLKKITAVFAAVLAMSCAVYAGEGDYIVKTKDGLVRAFSADGGMETLGDDMYVTTKSRAEKMLENGTAEAIEPDMPVYICDGGSETPNDPYYSSQVYMDKMKIPVLQQRYSGNVRIAVIDTGVNREHPDLVNANIEKGYNFVDENDDTADTMTTSTLNGHGTKVISVLAAQPNNGIGVAGVVPNAVIVPLVALTGSGGYTSDVIQAINAAVDDYDCKVINISLGVTYSKLLKVACDNAAEKGAVIICAAGNDGSTSKGTEISYPAGYSSTISVGSVLPNYTIASYSRRSEAIDTGVVLTSMYLPNNKGGYDYGAGTSYAAPVMSGIAAFIISEYPKFNVESIRDIIKGASADITGSGKDFAGYGVLMCDEIDHIIHYKHKIFLSPYISGSQMVCLKAFAKSNIEGLTLIKAAYSGGMLKSLETEPIVFDDENLFYTTAGCEEGDEMKFFVWDGLDTQRNYSDVR